MEAKSISNANLDELFDLLIIEHPQDSVLEAWREYPDRSAVADFLINKIREYQRILKDFPGNRFGNEQNGQGDSELRKLESGIRNGLRLLVELKEPRAASIISDLLAACLECEYRVVFSNCISALIDLGPASLEAIIEKYNSYRHCPDHHCVWLEILAKLGLKDDRIRRILENHLKFNRYEAVLAMGDYKDDYFIPAIGEIMHKSVKRLKQKQLNPFQRNIRVWDRDADIYI